MRILLLILLLSIAGFCQNIDKITSRCPSPNRSIYGSILIGSNGNITYIPCPNGTNTFSGTSIFPDSKVAFPLGIKLLNPNGVPVSSTATNYYLLSGSILSGQQFIIPSNDNLSITPTFNSPQVYGSYNFYTVNGTYTGGTLVGNYTQISNRLSTTSPTSTLTGIIGSASIDALTSIAIGGQFTSFTGGSGGGATPLIIGVQGVAGTHNTTNPLVIGGEFIVRNSIGGGGVINGVGSAIHSKIENLSATINDARGISFDSWSNAGTVVTSSVIYADSSVDVGTTRYFINSASTSPSNFAGNISITDNSKGLILKSPDNTCHLIAVSNANALSASTVTCP